MPDILTPIRLPVSVSSLATSSLALIAAASAWVSQGTIAASVAGGPRVAALPLSVPSILIVAAAAASVVAVRRAGASLAPLWLLTLVWLPWLPGPMPPAWLMWSGPLTVLVWIGIVVAVLAGAGGVATRARWRAWDAMVRRPPLAAFVLAFGVYAVAAWQVSPSIPGGDEPHYLIITQSLLTDGDIRIENNHRAGDYRAYFAGDLSKPDYRKRGRNGEIYSIHAPGLPVLIAPAFALGGYRGVVLFLLIVAAAGSALAWHLAWLVTRRIDAGWFGWAAVTFSTSSVFHSFTVYPDGPGGVLVLTGVWALLRAEQDAGSGDERTAPWLAHGAALALLPWVHTRFALIAGSLGALLLLRLGTNRNAAGKAVAFLAVPAVSALCWVGFFVGVYGSPDPSVPYANEEGSASFIPGGLAGLFFDQRFGLLAYAPVLLCCFVGLWQMVWRRPSRRLGAELLFVLVPYLLAVTHFAMWWGGTSAPARFFVPMLPMLAIPAAVTWTASGRTTRAAALGALVLTIFAAAALVLVDGGRLAYNVRQGYALWLEWLSPSTDLGRGLPAWWRGSDAILYRDIGVWGVAFAAAWGIMRALEGTRWTATRAALATATAAVYAVAAMASVTVLWRFVGVRGSSDTPSQLSLLRRVASEPRLLAFELPGLHRLAALDVPGMLSIEPAPSTTLGGAGPNDRPLFQIAGVPAGRYRLDPEGPNVSGWLMVGIGRDQFSLQSGPLSRAPVPILMDFPVDVRAIVVRGDEQARRSIQSLRITPLSIVPPGARFAAGPARQAVRYSGGTAYFLDDRSFAEPEAFWVGGGRTSSVVLQPETDVRAVAVIVRNGPVQNHAMLAAGAWTADLTLAPGEERRLDVPLEAGRRAALVTIAVSGGFRPSEIDPSSRDTRFLGLWVRIVN